MPPCERSILPSDGISDMPKAGSVVGKDAPSDPAEGRPPSFAIRLARSGLAHLWIARYLRGVLCPQRVIRGGGVR